MATKYDQSSATRPVSIRSHTSAFQVHFKHTSSALEMSSVNPPTHNGTGMQLIPLELVKSNRDSVRKAREAYPIERGQTLEPHGLNKKDET